MVAGLLYPNFSTEPLTQLSVGLQAGLSLTQVIDPFLCGFASGFESDDDDELLNEQATAPISETGHELGDGGPSDHLRDMIIDIPPFVLESESESEIENLESQPEPLRNGGTEAAGDMGSQQGWEVVGK